MLILFTRYHNSIPGSIAMREARKAGMLQGSSEGASQRTNKKNPPIWFRYAMLKRRA
jgi:hypothetical protein